MLTLSEYNNSAPVFNDNQLFNSPVKVDLCRTSADVDREALVVFGSDPAVDAADGSDLVTDGDRVTEFLCLLGSSTLRQDEEEVEETAENRYRQQEPDDAAAALGLSDHDRQKA